MMAMTTSSSMSVNARGPRRGRVTIGRHLLEKGSTALERELNTIRTWYATGPVGPQAGRSRIGLGSRPG